MNMLKHEPKKKSGVSPAAAVVTGVVVGAAFVGAREVLKNKKNRAKLKHALHSAKNQALDYISTLPDKTEQAREQMAKVVKTASDTMNANSKAKKVAPKRKTVKKTVAAK
jgi:L-lactate utilization protein LutB